MSNLNLSTRLALDVAVFAGIGLAYSGQTGTPAALVVGIAIISRIANILFQDLSFSYYHKDPIRDRLNNYAERFWKIDFSVNYLTIVALTYFKIIDRNGILLLSAFALGNALITPRLIKRGYLMPRPAADISV